MANICYHFLPGDVSDGDVVTSQTGLPSINVTTATCQHIIAGCNVRAATCQPNVGICKINIFAPA